MSRASNVSDVQFFQSQGCCQNEKIALNVGLRSIEKVSAVALGIFSAYKSLSLFVPFFLVGVCLGVHKFAQARNSCEAKQPVSSCSQSFLEQLTGVKQPPMVSLAANIAVTLCHIDHHANVFIPIIRLSLGTWLGNAAFDYKDLSFRKIKALFCQLELI